MYVGIIWGNGKTGTERSREAFRFALTLDPELILDEALASPGTRRSFELEQAEVTEAAPAPDRAPPPGGGEGAPPAQDLPEPR